MAAGIKNGEMRRGTAMNQRRVLALDNVEPADAGANVDSHALRDVRSDLELRLIEGFLRGGEGIDDEVAHLLQLFFLNVLKRVESLHLGRDVHGEAGGIKMRDGVYPALAGQKIFPGLGGVQTDGGQ